MFIYLVYILDWSISKENIEFVTDLSGLTRKTNLYNQLLFSPNAVLLESRRTNVIRHNVTAYWRLFRLWNDFFEPLALLWALEGNWRHETRRRVSANLSHKSLSLLLTFVFEVEFWADPWPSKLLIQNSRERKSLGRLCVQFHFSQVYSSWSLRRFHISTIVKFHGKTTKKYIKYLLTNVLFLHKANPQKMM